MRLSGGALTVACKAIGNLMSEVIRPGRCTLCGACVVTCPMNAISIKDYKPKLTGRCVLCGVCYNACPRTDINIDELEFYFLEAPRRDESIGAYRNVYLAKAALSLIHI